MATTRRNLNLPLVGRSKNFERSEEFFGWGDGAAERFPPPEKSFGFFDLPTRGR
jgi:hypothetical protein